jgi:hypothetical protein
MTFRDRWKRTSVHNQLMVMLTAIIGVLTLVNVVVAVVEHIRSSSQMDRLVRAAQDMDKSAAAAVQQNKKALEDTLQANKETLESTLAQGKAAMKASAAQNRAVLDASIETSRRDQRAWVTVSVANLSKPLAIGERPIVVLRMINSGKTPALDTAVAGTVVSRKEVSQVEFAQDATGAMQSRMVVGPSTAVSVLLDSSEPVTRQEQIDAVARGPWTLYASGFITYRDVFRVEHRTRFCFKLDAEGIKQGGLVMAACDRGNSLE